MQIPFEKRNFKRLLSMLISSKNFLKIVRYTIVIKNLKGGIIYYGHITYNYKWIVLDYSL